MSKSVVFTLIFVFLLTLVSSITLDGTLNHNVVIKEYGNSLKLDVEIKDAPPGDYNVYTLSDVHILPSETFYLDGTEFEAEFDVMPMDRLMDFEGSYVISYFLRQKDGAQVNDLVEISVLSVSDLFVIDTNSVPIEADKITVNLKNQYDVPVNDITVRFSSILFDFTRTFSVEENGNVSFEVDIDNEKLRTIKAGTYLIDAYFETPEGEKTALGILKLSEQEGITTQEESNGFLIKSTLINKINSGNVDHDVTVEVQKNIFTRFFTNFNLEPNSETREGFNVIYKWNSRIGPSEIFTIKATTNYFYPILIVVALIILFVFLRNMLATKLTLEKSVVPIKTKNGEFALRVFLKVKANKDLENVVLIDRVPKTVKIYKRFGAHTPDEIDATNRRLKWNVETLSAGDERTYSYIVYSRVGYVGRFFLPSCAARFSFNEKIYQVESNSVYFLAEQTNKVDD